MDEMHSIQTILPGAVAEIVRRAPMSPEKLAFAWKAAVGAAIDRATVVRLGENGTLEVRVESEPWRKELSRSAKLVVDRLGDWLGEGVVRKVTVIGPPGERPRRRAPAPPRRRVGGNAERKGVPGSEKPAPRKTTGRRVRRTGPGRRKRR